MVNSALATFILADIKARLSGWRATGKVSMDDVHDILTFLSIQLEKWMHEGGR